MKVLFPNRRFDHGPTKGGKAENDKYEDQYERTLILYKYFFGEAPEHIWEPMEVRFNPS
jgi:hypothetical protein